jgi:hypothetical protein
MFPETGENIPFNIQNYAYLDPIGRETVTWIRTFPGPRRGVSTPICFIVSNAPASSITWVRTNTSRWDIDLQARLTVVCSCAPAHQRFYEGAIGFSFPMLVSGTADVCEWYDDSERQFRIEVTVTNKTWERLFGYVGRFKVDWPNVLPNQIPPDILPRRIEARH